MDSYQYIIFCVVQYFDIGQSNIKILDWSVSHYQTARYSIGIIYNDIYKILIEVMQKRTFRWQKV